MAYFVCEYGKSNIKEKSIIDTPSGSILYCDPSYVVVYNFCSSVEGPQVPDYISICDETTLKVRNVTSKELLVLLKANEILFHEPSSLTIYCMSVDAFRLCQLLTYKGIVTGQYQKIDRSIAFSNGSLLTVYARRYSTPCWFQCLTIDEFNRMNLSNQSVSIYDYILYVARTANINTFNILLDFGYNYLRVNCLMFCKDFNPWCSNTEANDIYIADYIEFSLAYNNINEIKSFLLTHKLATTIRR